MESKTNPSTSKKTKISVGERFLNLFRKKAVNSFSTEKLRVFPRTSVVLNTDDTAESAVQKAVRMCRLEHQLRATYMLSLLRHRDGRQGSIQMIQESFNFPDVYFDGTTNEIFLIGLHFKTNPKKDPVQTKYMLSFPDVQHVFDFLARELVNFTSKTKQDVRPEKLRITHNAEVAKRHANIELIYSLGVEIFVTDWARAETSEELMKALESIKSSFGTEITELRKGTVLVKNFDRFGF